MQFALGLTALGLATLGLLAHATRAVADESLACAFRHDEVASVQGKEGDARMLALFRVLEGEAIGPMPASCAHQDLETGKFFLHACVDEFAGGV